jgi:hypothetical protein
MTPQILVYVYHTEFHHISQTDMTELTGVFQNTSNIMVAKVSFKDVTAYHPSYGPTYSIHL